MSSYNCRLYYKTCTYDNHAVYRFACKGVRLRSGLLQYCTCLSVCIKGHWDSMEEYTCMIPRDTHDGAFYRAVLALHQDLFSLAQQVSEGSYLQWWSIL